MGCMQVDEGGGKGGGGGGWLKGYGEGQGPEVGEQTRVGNKEHLMKKSKPRHRSVEASMCVCVACGLLKVAGLLPVVAAAPDFVCENVYCNFLPQHAGCVVFLSERCPAAHHGLPQLQRYTGT